MYILSVCIKGSCKNCTEAVLIKGEGKIPTGLGSFEESCLNEKRKENEEWATEVEEISESKA